MFGYLLESPQSPRGDSNKHPKHLFYEEQNKTFLNINLLIKYYVQQQFHLKATSLGTNTVVVTRVHCIKSLSLSLSLSDTHIQADAQADFGISKCARGIRITFSRRN